MTQVLSENAAAVLKKIETLLAWEETCRIDRSDGLFTRLYVERLSPTEISLAHYFEQNGDLVPDPEGVFERTEEGWRMASMKGPFDTYTEAVGEQSQRTLNRFAEMWLRNLSMQQGLT